MSKEVKDYKIGDIVIITKSIQGKIDVFPARAQIINKYLQGGRTIVELILIDKQALGYPLVRFYLELALLTGTIIPNTLDDLYETLNRENMAARKTATCKAAPRTFTPEDKKEVKAKEPVPGVDTSYYNPNDIVPAITKYGYKIPKTKKKKWIK